MHTGFPKGVWAELHDRGRINYHPVFPQPAGPRLTRFESEADARNVIGLLRLNDDQVVSGSDFSEEPGA